MDDEGQDKEPFMESQPRINSSVDNSGAYIPPSGMGEVGSYSNEAPEK